ncbi:MAG TPA: ring-cleaving dioxygenase [Tepidisphaeraceae bacterium]|nr:ring-cleaving dioxygenase [Tepidisphaeraceae bacterium]
MAEKEQTLAGLHHVTAITSDPQKNIDFYCGVLGLRLVKLTVNFDDPGSYHLYYGDELGRPGTVLTFFAWPGAHRGRIGIPQVATTSFSVPAGSLEFWKKRLEERQWKATLGGERFGERVLELADPDGMQLELVASSNMGGRPWKTQGIAAEQAIRGFHSVSLVEEGYEKTAKLLTDFMRFREVGSDRNRFRYQATSGDGFASIVDVLCTPAGRVGSLGAGVVHHVAFRTPDDAQQEEWHRALGVAGYNVSPVMDRCYFHSIYYREPGGVLFEIATENPGFTADETAAELGTKLKLPSWLEKYRPQIERVLPAVKLP